MSLKENIEIAAANSATNPLQDQPELLRAVIHMAHLTEVVARLPNGLDTVIGEKGIKLSGGQRQRLGIARALYRQPDILLMDEATSHLDVHSEKEIQKALEECLQNFTTIVIAHRLSTIKAMDKIIVLEHGAVAEEGTFEELLQKQGSFARMWREQKL
jgi:subfamily B ATP-binding cassette protein MsbA